MSKVTAKTAAKVAANTAAKTAAKTAPAASPRRGAKAAASTPAPHKTAKNVVKATVKPIQEQTRPTTAKAVASNSPATKAVAAHAPAAKPTAAAPVAKAVASAPAAKAAVKATLPKAPPPPAGTATAVAEAVKPPPRVKSTAQSRATSRYAVPMPTAPLPPPTSRFADRFAPPRPPTRQMNNLTEDSPRVAHKQDPKLANAWKSKSGRDLTDAELLAMPDSEYMNDKQLDFFRGRLQALKDDLLSNAGETTEHLREDTSIVPDPADRATIEEEHALELRTRDRERKLLKKISQSLGRIEAGDYGFCDETGEPIGLGRLIARPTATLSLEAQQRRELKQKMFGD